MEGGDLSEELEGQAGGLIQLSSLRFYLSTGSGKGFGKGVRAGEEGGGIDGNGFVFTISHSTHRASS